MTRRSRVAKRGGTRAGRSGHRGCSESSGRERQESARNAGCLTSISSLPTKRQLPSAPKLSAARAFWSGLSVFLVLNRGPTISDGALTGYLDGVAFGSGAGSQLWSHSGDIGIGRTDGLAEGLDHLTKFHDGDASDADDAFAGMLDEIRVHNRALSSEEIANLAAEDLIAPPSSASPLSAAAADVLFAEGTPISEQEQLSPSTSASPSPTPIPSPGHFRAQPAETAFGRRGLPRWVFADNLAGLIGRPW